MSYYGARYYEPKTSVWLSVDPLAEEFAGRSPYEYCFNNPVKFTDPTGMSPDNEYDENGKKISTLGGETTNYYHQKNGSVIVEDVKSKEKQTIQASKTGESLLLDYDRRGTKINGLIITNEYFSGEGPENSLIYGNDKQMNKDIQTSAIFKNALDKFQKTDMNKKMYSSGEGEFGLIGAAKAGTNLTLQVLGKFGVSFYPIGDKVLVFVTDSKSKNSVNPILKMMAEFTNNSEYGNISRKIDTITPEGNTRQTYMFELPKSYFKKK